MTVLGIGTAIGLVFALPVKTGSAACPPAGEGRVNCLVQNAWAPAFVKLAATVLAVWLVADMLGRVPQLLRRYRSGERVARRPADLGREAVLGDSVLAAATWGIVPPASRRPVWRVVKPEPNPTLASALAGPAPMAEAPAPTPSPAERVAVPRIAGVRALTAAERLERSRGMVARHVRVLTDGESRTRRLRRGTDPALVVSCWSDASSARSLPDAVVAPVPVAASR